MNKQMKICIGSILIVAMLVAPQLVVATDLFAYTEENDRGTIGSSVDYAYSQSASNSIHYYYYSSYHDAYAASSVGYCTGHALHSGVWTYEIWFNGEMNSSGTYGWHHYEMLEASGFDVDVTQNTSACDLYVVNQNKHVWSTGGDMRDYYYDQYIANTMISGLLTIISAAGGSPAWTIATAVAGALLNGGYNSHTVNTSSLWYLWQWSDGSNDAYETMYFRADVDNGASTQITCNFHVFGMGFELLTSGPIVLNIAAPSNSRTSDPYLMTPEERESCGIITVNKSNVEDLSPILHISSNEVEEIKASNEDYYYVTDSITAITLSEEEVIEQAVENTDSMIQYLETEKERSQMIIDVFSDSSNEDMDYRQSVIDKHRGIQDWIDTAVDRLENGGSPEKIMDEYQNMKTK